MGTVSIRRENGLYADEKAANDEFDAEKFQRRLR
jgi:hypothetical protein